MFDLTRRKNLCLISQMVHSLVEHRKIETRFNKSGGFIVAISVSSDGSVPGNKAGTIVVR